MTDFEAKLIDRDDELDISSIYLTADFKNRTVRTNCGDFYYDYDIDFDGLFRFVEQVKQMDKEINGDKDNGKK